MSMKQSGLNYTHVVPRAVHIRGKLSDNPYILKLETQCRRPEIFQTMNSAIDQIILNHLNHPDAKI